MHQIVASPVMSYLYCLYTGWPKK